MKTKAVCLRQGEKRAKVMIADVSQMFMMYKKLESIRERKKQNRKTSHSDITGAVMNISRPAKMFRLCAVLIHWFNHTHV